MAPKMSSPALHYGSARQGRVRFKSLPILSSHYTASRCYGLEQQENRSTTGKGYLKAN